MMTSELHTAREFAIALSQRAGALALEFQQGGLRTDQVRIKSHPADLVTEADTAVEAVIEAAIGEAFPEHGIYAEESAAQGMPRTAWTWIVDPIDGTTNFAHSLPLYCVNIALTHAGRPVIGVTCAPALNTVYWAEEGQGAWARTDQGDAAIRVTTIPALREALLATGFAHGRRRSTPSSLAEFSALDAETHAVRRLGSAALAAAWVAAGLLEGYWEAEIMPWDGAAGAVLVREAGGKVTDDSGRPWELNSRYIVASNGQPGIHDAVLETIGAAHSGLLYLERRSL